MSPLFKLGVLEVLARLLNTQKAGERLARETLRRAGPRPSHSGAMFLVNRIAESRMHRPLLDAYPHKAGEILSRARTVLHNRLTPIMGASEGTAISRRIRAAA